MDLLSIVVHISIVGLLYILYRTRIWFSLFLCESLIEAMRILITIFHILQRGRWKLFTCKLFQQFYPYRAAVWLLPGQSSQGPHTDFHLIFDTSLRRGQSCPLPSFVSSYIILYLEKLICFSEQEKRKSDFYISETLILTDKQKSDLWKEKIFISEEVRSKRSNI